MQTLRRTRVSVLPTLAVAGLIVTAAGPLVVGAETTPNARLQIELDGQTMGELVTFNFEQFKTAYVQRPRRSGAVDITIRKSTAVAREFAELARTKRRIPALSLKSTERDKEGKYHEVKLKNCIITSYSFSSGGDMPSESARVRLTFEQVDGVRP